MAVYDQVEDPRLLYLKEFQCNRLRQTYADFTAQKEYTAACFFFFNRLYSTEDSTERDESFRKIHKLVKRYLGGEVVESMDRLIELQELTLVLDKAMLDVLQQENAPIEFDTAAYEHAYRVCDNYQPRVRQIELLEFINRLIHKISHRFGIGMALQGLRAGCLVIGDTRMVDFLMDGYRAFADIRRIDPLVEAIGSRERARLDRIYGLIEDAPW